MSQLFEGLKISYNEDFKQFKKENYFFNELDFVNMLLKAYTLNEVHPCIQSFLEQCDDDSFKPTLFNHNLSAHFVSFLDQRRQELETTIKSQEPDLIDLSDESRVGKIIILNELGIIEFLQKQPCFTASVNNLASVLSAITGIKPTTLQTSLNRLKNKDTDDHRHPYHTQKTVEKIKSQLINLGVRPK